MKAFLLTYALVPTYHSHITFHVTMPNAHCHSGSDIAGSPPSTLPVAANEPHQAQMTTNIVCALVKLFFMFLSCYYSPT